MVSVALVHPRAVVTYETQSLETTWMMTWAGKTKCSRQFDVVGTRTILVVDDAVVAVLFVPLGKGVLTSG